MHRHTITWVILFAVIAGMFVQLPQMAARQDALMNTYSALVEVDALARQRFVEPIEDDRLVDGAIRGMMLKLDPYSGYVAAEELPGFERRTHGNFIGVGIELGIRDGVPTIIAPIEGSPAAAAGVRPGDVIVAIDEVEVKGLSLFDIEERLGGPPGSTLALQVVRAGESRPHELTIVRGPVTLAPVRGVRRNEDATWDYMLDSESGIAYLRITSFPETLSREFDRALRAVLRQGARGLVLDLRSNPGGLLDQAVELVDRFVGSGVIVSTVSRRRAVQEYHASEPGTVDGLELAVLIDRASASSSEIVAGSLQDHGRAVVVGERSFGKGSVQHLIPLTGQPAAVKLTVAYYRLPGGRLIHRTPRNVLSATWGVRPDIEVEDSHRRDSDGSSVNGQSTDPTAAEEAPEESAGPDPATDAQLAAAMELLRKKLVDRRRDFAIQE